MRNKIAGLTILLSVALIAGFNGCVSYEHKQGIRNETGSTLVQVYIKDTGTTDWGNPRNARSPGGISYDEYIKGTYILERYDIAQGTQIDSFFRESTESETPPGISNKDIRVIDGNGMIYSKSNVPIVFTTTERPFFGTDKVLNRAAPITFTVQDRHPTLTMLNNTGYPVGITAPVNQGLNNGARTIWCLPELGQNQNITVTYKVGNVQYDEQVTIGDDDVTLALTRRPPVVTIENNTGFTVNLVFLRNPGDNWPDQNLLTLRLKEDGTLDTTEAAVQAGERRGSITNRDSFRFWIGNVSINADRYDIRIDDVQGNSYVKSNVAITSDMTLTFTQSDKR